MIQASRSGEWEAPWAAPRPDISALMRWIDSAEVVTSAGVVMSWSSATNPGYPYPEVAGLWLTARVGREPTGPTEDLRADTVAAWLVSQVAEDGSVGRWGRRYLFDSAVALTGLAAHARHRRTDVHRPAMDRLFGFIASCVARRQAVSGPEDEGPLHWSTSYGSHLLKAVVGLHSYADLAGVEAARRVAERLVDDLLPLFGGTRFVIAADSDLTYLHGCLYAFEGLTHLHTRQLGDHREVLERGADWLVTLQRPSGGLPAFATGAGPFGASRTDATAQAVRLWSLMGRRRWSDAIVAGLAHLRSRQHVSGGVEYADDIPDVNTWASLFTLQALRWSDGQGRSETVV